MRRLRLCSYPETWSLNHPNTISDTISLQKLQEVRIENDYKDLHGYAYAEIGNNQMVDRWIKHGVEAGLLNGFWQSDLERFARMDRGPANQVLMDQLNFDEL